MLTVVLILVTLAGLATLTGIFCRDVVSLVYYLHRRFHWWGPLLDTVLVLSAVIPFATFIVHLGVKILSRIP